MRSMLRIPDEVRIELAPSRPGDIGTTIGPKPSCFIERMKRSTTAMLPAGFDEGTASA
jgi:hypothetical protein